MLDEARLGVSAGVPVPDLALGEQPAMARPPIRQANTLDEVRLGGWLEASIERSTSIGIGSMV